MANDDLIMKITADTAQLRQQLAEVDRKIAAFARQSNDAAQSTERSLGAAFAKIGAAAQAFSATLAGLGVIQIARQIVDAGDAFQQMQARLVNVTGSVDAANAAFQSLLSIASRTGNSLADTSSQFARFSLAARDIGASRTEVLRLIETVQKLGTVSGASTAEAAGAATQLAQALASGKLQGDELRSILETMPNLADLLARNLGVSIGRLREMGTAGELTSDKVFGALLKGSAEVDKAFEKMPLTVERASAQASIAWTKFLSTVDRAAGLSERTARALAVLAGELSDIDRRVNRTTRDRIADLRAEVEELQKNPSGGGPVTGFGRDRRAEALEEEIRALERQAQAEERGAARRRVGAKATEEQDKRNAEYLAGLGRVKAANDDLATSQEKAQAAFKKREKELQDLRDRGFLSEEEYSALLKKAQDELADALNKGATATDDAGKALEKYGSRAEKVEAEIRKLNAAFAKGNVSVEGYAESFNRITGIDDLFADFGRQVEQQTAGIAKQYREMIDALPVGTKEDPSPFAGMTKDAQALDSLIRDTLMQSFEDVGDGLARSLVRGGNAFKALGDIGLQVVDSLISAMIRLSVINPLINSLGLSGGAPLPVFPGFSSGGWTGNAPPNRVAGVVHGQEFVVKAGPAARYRDMLEGMNAGQAPTFAPPASGLAMPPVTIQQRSSLSVNVYGAPAGTEATVERRTGPDGSEALEIYLDRKIAQMVDRRASSRNWQRQVGAAAAPIRGA